MYFQLNRVSKKTLKCFNCILNPNPHSILYHTYILTKNQQITVSKTYKVNLLSNWKCNIKAVKLYLYFLNYSIEFIDFNLVESISKLYFYFFWDFHRIDQLAACVPRPNIKHQQNRWWTKSLLATHQGPLLTGSRYSHYLPCLNMCSALLKSIDQLYNRNVEMVVEHRQK